MPLPSYPHLTSSPLFATLAPTLLEALEPELQRVRLAADQTLVRQGEVAAAMYVLVSGALDVVVGAGGEARVLDRLGPGAAVGEMALIAGQRRSATVVATAPAELVKLPRAGFERLAARVPELHDAVARAMAPRLQRVQLSGVVDAWFGALDPDRLHALQEAMAWVHLGAGDALYREGDDGGDAMYLLVSGRLRLSRRRPGAAGGPVTAAPAAARARADRGPTEGAAGAGRSGAAGGVAGGATGVMGVTGGVAGDDEVLADVGRGEAVGAYAVLADAPRRETVVALRDSHLVRLDRALVAAHPQVIARIARIALSEANDPRPRRGRGNGGRGNGVRTIAVVPARPGAPADALARQLGARLDALGPTGRLDAAAVDAAFGRDGVAQVVPGASSDPALAHWLNEREAAHDLLVLVADATVTPWTRRCLRQADVVLVVADAGADPAPGPLEREAARVIGDVHLVLVHPDATGLPSGTARWLEARPPLPHHHLRLGNNGDAARLARRITGRAVGLVFSGGGARGYAHIGLIRAIEEAGLDVDMVMGTSMGALVGGAYALRGEFAFCREAAAAFGDSRKLVDRTLPLVALTESRGVTELFRHMFADIRIEDLWTPFACVSANLTRAEPVVHARGPLWHAVRASTAIPGVFTPLLHDGEMLVDGGVMNAFPVDLMREWVGSGVVIGSNTSSHGSPREAYDFGPSISGWSVLAQRLLPRGRRRAYPSILSTLMRATSLSSKHLIGAARALADLVVEYPTDAYGSLDFGRYDELIDIGYRVAREALQAWDPALPDGPAEAAPRAAGHAAARAGAGAVGSEFA